MNIIYFYLGLFCAFVLLLFIYFYYSQYKTKKQKKEFAIFLENFIKQEYKTQLHFIKKLKKESGIK